MSSITLTADRRSVKKGESINVSWTSSTPDSLVLVIDDGDSVQRVQVPDCGTRTCCSNRATKDMSLNLIAVTNGHKESSSLRVKVKSERETETKAGIGKWQRVLQTVLVALPIVLIVISLLR